MLIIDNKRGLKSAIALLDPFPDREEFQEFTAVYQEVRLANGPTTLCQVLHAWYEPHCLQFLMCYMFMWDSQNIKQQMVSRLNS